MFSKKSTKSDWDKVWNHHDTKESYNYGNSRTERARDKVSTFIDNGIVFNENDKVLEAGCGDGSVVFQLIKNFNVNCVGLDFSKVAKDETLKLMQKNHISFQYDLGDVHKLPYDDESFDKIISLGVIEHFNDNDIIIKEMKRVLKPNGIVILMTPNKYSFGRLDRLFKQLIGQWKFGYQTEYSNKELTKLAHENGFNVLNNFTQLRYSKPNDSISFKVISRIDQFMNIFSKQFGFYSYVFLTK